MQDQGTANNVLQAVQILLSIAPVPGLAAAAIAIQEVLKLVNNVAARRSECEALAGFATNVLATINSSAKVREDSQMAMAISAVTKVIADMQTDFGVWKNYSRLTGYIQNSEIRSRIEGHRAGLNEALITVGLTQTLAQAEWNQKFTEAHSEDQVLLQDISQKQDQTNKEITELKQLLIPSSVQRTDNEAEENRASVMQKLSHLRSQPGVLTSSDLIYEVQKTGDRPFHSGALYELWKGVWLDKYVVVLKVFRGKDLTEQPTNKAVDRINRQVDLWRTLKHDNILPLCGIYHLKERGRDDASVCFVSPWMTNRDMMRYLKIFPNANRLKLIHDVAKGLQYLHSVGILHGALQGSNVLVNDGGSAVLSDFSLSKSMEPDTMMSQTGSQSSLRWWAPETQNHQTLSSHTDVYSWAMTALQIVSGHEPYYNIKAIGQLVSAINKHITPKRSDYDDSGELLKNDRLWSLLEACWNADPKKRPSMDQVVTELEALGSGSVASSEVAQAAVVNSQPGSSGSHTPPPVATTTLLVPSTEPVPSTPQSTAMQPPPLTATLLAATATSTKEESSHGVSNPSPKKGLFERFINLFSRIRS
ncbi:hypothetical protein FRB95_005023 [Tulasnella sp. JGI-2019a]|nr:hypothetical protein FRB95_005023 [Tulasnella sp. JGI-2019a]